jgi:hypothetical protein
VALVRWASPFNYTFSKCNDEMAGWVLTPGVSRVVRCQSTATPPKYSKIDYRQQFADCK